MRDPSGAYASVDCVETTIPVLPNGVPPSDCAVAVGLTMAGASVATSAVAVAVLAAAGRATRATGRSSPSNVRADRAGRGDDGWPNVGRLVAAFVVAPLSGAAPA